MRLGASILGFFPLGRPAATWPTLAEAVEAVLSLESSLGVEVWGARAPDEPPVSGQSLVELVEACREAPFVTVHVQGRHWQWDPAGLRHEIDFVHQVGGETLVLHPSCLGLERPEARPDWPEIIRIADYAAKFGVRLAVENIFDSVWCLDRILEEIGDDPDKTNLGVCIDVGHAALSKDAGRDAVCNYLERYAGQLVHLHLHDNRGEGDEHLVPGEGTANWPRILDVVKAIDFSGTAVLETRQPALSPRDNVKQGIKFIREVLDS